MDIISHMLWIFLNITVPYKCKAETWNVEKKKERKTFFPLSGSGKWLINLCTNLTSRLGKGCMTSEMFISLPMVLKQHLQSLF